MTANSAEYMRDYRAKRAGNGGAPGVSSTRRVEFQRRAIVTAVRKLRKKEPWPEFGVPSGCEGSARAAYNEALYEVIDLIEEM